MGPDKKNELGRATPGPAPTCQLVYGVDHEGGHARTHARAAKQLLLSLKQQHAQKFLPDFR
jgi:hypothetical protein